jgi:hypothetical protein
VAHDQESKRYLLPFTQEWFLTTDKGDGGPFGRRYLIVCALVVLGREGQREPPAWRLVERGSTRRRRSRTA